MRTASTLRASLITLGDPERSTGGYLYHRRMAQLAPLWNAELRFVSVPDWPFPTAAFLGRRAMCLASEWQPDAILVDSIAAAFLSTTSVQCHHCLALIGVLHQPPGGVDHGPARRRLQAWLDMRLYRRCQLLLVASQYLADQMVAKGMPRQRIRVVPPGRDASQGGGASPRGDLRGGTSTAFLCVANWLEHKGIHLLLEAFARLPADAGVLHLVGNDHADERYGQRIEQRLSESDLRGRVVVHGAVRPDQVADFYAAADVFVLASSVETYGTVYGEAMAMGLPLVGLRGGNLPYLASHGVEALIAEPGDVAGLADSLLQLATDASLRRQMGEAARRRSLAWPTWSQTAESFFSAIREVSDRRVT